MLLLRTRFVSGLLASVSLITLSAAQTPQRPDLTKEPTLYVVGYAHLDTEWRWEYPQVINEYLRRRRWRITSSCSISIRTIFSTSAERIGTG